MYIVLISDSFADRDMFMRYLGGGIGHRGSNPGVNYIPETTASKDPEEAATENLHAYGDTKADKPMNEHPSVAEIECNAMAIENMAELLQDTIVLPGLVAYNDSEEDYGYESSSADSIELDVDHDIDLLDKAIDHLGTEDGEETTGTDKDLEDLEGYAAF
jgi:hypothetical protein